MYGVTWRLVWYVKYINTLVIYEGTKVLLQQTGPGVVCAYGGCPPQASAQAGPSKEPPSTRLTHGFSPDCKASGLALGVSSLPSLL